MNQTIKEMIKSKYSMNVDVVFCIDSMNIVIANLDNIKNGIRRFVEYICSKMTDKIRPIGELRVKFVTLFDDSVCERNSMRSKEFYTFPNESETFKRDLDLISAADVENDGDHVLEMLGHAIRSNSNSYERKKRQIIVFWSDFGIYPIGDGEEHEDFSEEKEKTLSELACLWESCMDYKDKRLILFAPDCSYWRKISRQWGNVIHCPPDESGESVYSADEYVEFMQWGLSDNLLAD